MERTFFLLSLGLLVYIGIDLVPIPEYFASQTAIRTKEHLLYLNPDITNDDIDYVPNFSDVLASTMSTKKGEFIEFSIKFNLDETLPLGITPEALAMHEHLHKISNLQFTTLKVEEAVVWLLIKEMFNINDVGYNQVLEFRIEESGLTHSNIKYLADEFYDQIADETFMKKYKFLQKLHYEQSH